MRRLHSILSIACLLVFSGVCRAFPDGRVCLEQLSVDEGLPHTDVGAVLQDGNGFIYIGTYSGLCRYDGIEMTCWNISNSILESSRIMCLCLGSGGILYVGTETGGVTLYDTVNDCFVRTVPVPKNCVNRILEYSDDCIFILTNDGVSVLDLREEGYDVSSWSFAQVTDGAVCSDGQLLLCTDKGLMSFSRSGGGRLLDGFNVATSLLPLGGERYFLTSYSGSAVFDRRDCSLVMVDDVETMTSAMDASGNIWVGTRAAGVICYDRDFNKIALIEPEGPGAVQCGITSLFFDASDVLWAGTIGSGCYKGNANTRVFHTWSLPDDGGNAQVLAMMADSRDRLWVSSRNGGLYVLSDGGLVRVDGASLEYFRGNPVSAVYQDGNSDVLLGSWNRGALRIPASEVAAAACGAPFRAYPMTGLPEVVSIFKFAQAQDGSLWISSNKGVLHWERDGVCERFCHDPSDENTVADDFTTDILVGMCDSVQTVWAGSRVGMTRIVREASSNAWKVDRIAPSKNSSGLYGEFVSVIHRDASGSLWVATLGGGLNRLVSDPLSDSLKFVQYNKEEYPFPNNEFESLLEDADGNFWIGGYGLMRFNPADGSLKRYMKNDGLQSNVFKIWAAASLGDGRLAFGGIRGFNVFDPRQLSENEIPPAVVLTGLSVNGKPYADVGGGYPGKELGCLEAFS